MPWLFVFVSCPWWFITRFAAEFDMSKKITTQGTVTRVERPHTRLWVETKNDDATASTWGLELPPPNALKRMLASRDFVKQGDQVGVTFWRAKDGTLLGCALSMVFADGRVMNLAAGWL